jgi:Ca2+-binding EF-hand superfamily protein
MRVTSAVPARFGVCAVLLFGPALAQAQLPGNFDTGRIFDLLARGRPAIRIADMNNSRQAAQAWARQHGITNGELNREQFMAYMRDRLRSSGFGSVRPPASPPATPAAPMTRERVPPPESLAPERRTPPADNPNAWADEWFRRLDRNGDGVLSVGEMTENLKAERHKWDLNEDGVIDLQEYRAYVKAFIEQRMREEAGRGRSASAPTESRYDAQQTRTNRRQKVNVPRWFKEYDLDGDGQVSLYEWQEKGGSVEAFRKLDLNRDGFITLRELARGGALTSGNGNTPPGTKPDDK